jgi:hypothetical protein
MSTIKNTALQTLLFKEIHNPVIPGSKFYIPVSDLCIKMKTSSLRYIMKGFT